MKKDQNERIIGGNIYFRRFAYLHKLDKNRFGLLEALNLKNARDHLGGEFHIRETWLTVEESQAVGFNCERRWEIVSSIFLNPSSVAFVGKRLRKRR